MAEDYSEFLVPMGIADLLHHRAISIIASRDGRSRSETSVMAAALEKKCKLICIYR